MGILRPWGGNLRMAMKLDWEGRQVNKVNGIAPQITHWLCHKSEPFIEPIMEALWNYETVNSIINTHAHYLYIYKPTPELLIPKSLRRYHILPDNARNENSNNNLGSYLFHTVSVFVFSFCIFQVFAASPSGSFLSLTFHNSSHSLHSITGFLSLFTSLSLSLTLPLPLHLSLLIRQFYCGEKQSANGH